ncbi:hypothetical protein [Sphingomonas sp. RB1R13]
MAASFNTTRAPRALFAIITAAAIGCAPIIAAVLASAQVAK